MAQLTKHINVRITEPVSKQIDSIKEELTEKDAMIYTRSQVIFMLIVRGIEKYNENQLNEIN